MSYPNITHGIHIKQNILIQVIVQMRDKVTITVRNNLPLFKNSKLACNVFKFELVFVFYAYITIYIICLQNNITSLNRFSFFHSVSKVLCKLVLKVARNLLTMSLMKEDTVTSKRTKIFFYLHQVTQIHRLPINLLKRKDRIKGQIEDIKTSTESNKAA